MELFKGEFIGMHDKNGAMLTEGCQVKLYYKGAYVVYTVIYKPEWGMFCLKWPDGYINKWPIDSEKLEVVADS